MNKGSENMKSINYLRQFGADIDSSLELFGDEATYNETLTEFQRGIDGKLAEIDKYYQQADMPNYAILVHSLKSDCKYFGFKELADIAYQHELASKESNINFVRTNYEKLIQEAKKVRRIVNDYFDDSIPETAVNNVSPAVQENPAPAAKENEDIILVADDSEVIRIFVKKIFDAEYELAFATNGDEALNIIKEHATDNRIKAILLDLNMPVKDGFAVLDYLKDNNLLGVMPVTIVSGDSSREAIDKAFAYNIVDMLSKPFNEAKIKEVVERTINSHK